jgi:DNA-binding transcriptional MerR regulator
MNSLTKIRDVSAKYSISARTLRYYEDMGLVSSTRGDDYAYRLYDDAALKRLEQVLILRKLNIGIKDIQRIFNTTDSEAVLEVLGKKVDDIDEEVALLHELKEIVVAFIRQIEQVDFNKGTDVKLLYDKAKEIKTQLAHLEYKGNPSAVNRLFEVTDKLAQKAVSKLSIPDNILKRLLQNVYFILGDGAAVADELGRRYGIYVYHTCDNRYKHSQNADPRFQPGLCSFEEDIPDFWARDPEEALRHEREVVHDFTPMVIMDLIQLTATHEKIICENDIDIDSIIEIVSHAVLISNEKGWDEFIGQYENKIRSRDISKEEKDDLIRKVNVAWGRGKPENPRGANPYGIMQIYLSDDTTTQQTADKVAEYFGLSHPRTANLHQTV